MCVIKLSEEVDRLQMISEGMDQTVKKKCMCKYGCVTEAQKMTGGV